MVKEHESNLRLHRCGADRGHQPDRRELIQLDMDPLTVDLRKI